MRLILVTGGGGAGVTTFAAATALCAAGRGTPTRLASADPPSIARTLGTQPSLPSHLAVIDTPTSDPWNDDTAAVLAWLRPALRWLDLNESMPEDLAAFPGVRGLAALLAAVEDRPDLGVVDLGPSDEALALLQLLCLDPPRDRHSNAGRITGQIAGNLVARAFDVPRPSESVKAAGRRLTERIAALHSWIRDPEVTSLRAVIPADSRTADLITDARTFAGLWGIGLDALILRSAPPTDGTLDDRLSMPDCSDPPHGIEQLQALGDAIYGSRSPAARLTEPHVPRIELRESGADLVLPVPEQPASAFRVRREGVDLHVKAGRWRRTFPLPSPLLTLRGRRAWHDGSVFRVRFEA